MTDPAAAELITAAGAVPQSRSAQQEDLDEVMNRLDNAASAQGRSAGPQVPDGIGAWYVDEAAGVVVVEATDVAAGEEFKAAAGDAAGSVEVRPVPEAPRPYFDLIGGDAIYAAAGGARSASAHGPDPPRT